jgi:hypothetical protein
MLAILKAWMRDHSEIEEDLSTLLVTGNIPNNDENKKDLARRHSLIERIGLFVLDENRHVRVNTYQYCTRPLLESLVLSKIYAST